MESLDTRFHREVFVPYLDLLKAQYRFHHHFSHPKKTWEEKLTVEELVKGPYLEKAQLYAREALENLKLHEKTISTIKKRLDGQDLYKHQKDALKLLLDEGENVVLATGTSSGKTLCYQIPILDDLIRDSSPGLRAIIIYPLNALVNDQLKEWEEILTEHKEITFARFTGQTPSTEQEYEEREKIAIREQLANQQLTQSELQFEIQQRLEKKLKTDPPNRLNHRDAIRANPPQILVTNFSMLEYLLMRPVDAPIFEKVRLKFLVLDEVHAYRGVQATEIAFLVRRLKDRLGAEKLTCIATSATLGKSDNEPSKVKVRKFASDIFDEPFREPNPIYGTTVEPLLSKPSFCPTTQQYIEAAEALRKDNKQDLRKYLGTDLEISSLPDLLAHDENLYRLLQSILVFKPTHLRDAAEKLWPNLSEAEDGLQALLEIVAIAKRDNSHEDLLPTRLHYFIRAQDGLHVCLHKQCPGRRDGKPAFFVSRKNGLKTPEGLCPECFGEGRRSQLVEVVSCRKCGYLFGALQDLGPRRARSPENGNDPEKIDFDSFSTELGWAADSFWSYFSVENDLPYPSQPKTDEEEEEDLFLNPAELDWCVICGKKKEEAKGDNCTCQEPHLRKIRIFHRQCPHFGRAKDRANLNNQEKKSLTYCPNCGARNASGLEPVRRFQESDDETGLAMAIPLAHFKVSPNGMDKKEHRKLLCFTDHRQRAAAFPSLLEEETFVHDIGRKIVQVVHSNNQSINFVDLGERLADIANSDSLNFDPDFFLPISRFPDEQIDAKRKRDLWVAEVFSYFGIPDSARESAEDLGLLTIEYRLKDSELYTFQKLLQDQRISKQDAYSILQVLLGFMRHKKAFTLPTGRVEANDPAFGRVTPDFSFKLRRDKEDRKSILSWGPRINIDGSYNDNYVTDYLRRFFHFPQKETLDLAKNIWQFLLSKMILIENKGSWKLDHERLYVQKPSSRYVCNRCGIIITLSAQCCPRKGCEGSLEEKAFDASQENIIARWVAGLGEPQFSSLRSEEHTAQINKELAKKIEDRFRNEDKNRNEDEIRVEGIAILSSTTTFELGVNIGDLQKVLLRNAPPTSASYVQRVGRSGRGADKNSVCVTFCRRTKYDSDAWGDPSRLMSGELRAPSVFISNELIAQRHFNAIAFAKFLRIKVRDERLLGEPKQQIRLETFLPPDVRVGIPAQWIQARPTNLFLNFVDWLEICTADMLLQTQSAKSILTSVGGIDSARQKSINAYSEVINNVAHELSALLTERKELFEQGKFVSDIEQAIKNLLGSDVIAVMARRGFLPRYAFPLDVVTLETGLSRWSRDTDVELSRDRGIAISEFAPGAQVIAHKKVFTSAGLYVVSKMDAPTRQWYSRCPSCDQIRVGSTQDSLNTECEVCQRKITRQFIKPFVEPFSFSVRIDRNKESLRHRRHTLIRQRAPITHFIDSVPEAEFRVSQGFHLALREKGSLFRYNLGPKNQGFVVCQHCGFSEPFATYEAAQTHKRLRASIGKMNCQMQPWSTAIAYGYQFNSWCLIARPILMPLSVESLAFALRRGLCKTLDIETLDIGVSWRWLSKRTEAHGVEIVLYDNTHGGSGFVKEGYENWEEVVQNAFVVCDRCNCVEACYDCLKDYYNQCHHERLDRATVVDFLKQ